VQSGARGRYELLRKIAAGGMAEIFLARWWAEAGFCRDVVIKRLFRNLAEHGPTLRMFQYEAHLLAHLTHPNIPQVYDLGFADDTWYLAMEHVEGWNVADVWRAGAKQGRAMPLPVVIAVMLQICEALHHAHEAVDRARRPLRIVHRDVTPQNVMLTRDGVAKLMDFGVAKTDARNETEAGVVKGTFSYMAPEQVRGRAVDRRADVFSLGVILYELTTGSRLYRGSDMEVMTAVVEKDAPPPSTRVRDYPSDLEEIVVAALRRDARSRVQSAADLALHLEHFAIRHGAIVGPRTVAHYLEQILPSERIGDEALALVPQEAEALQDIRTNDLASEELVSGASFEAIAIDTDDDDAEVVDDDELIETEGDDGVSPFHLESVPPEPLPGFMDADVTGERPVVLLDTKKRDSGSAKPPEEDYISELEKRLSREDD